MTLAVAAPAAARTYTIPDAGANVEFTMLGNDTNGTGDIVLHTTPTFTGGIDLIDSGTLRLRESSAGANYVGLQSGGAMAANYTIQFPVAAPTGDQYLRVNASGVGSWVSGSSTIDVQEGDTSVVAAADTIDFDGDDFDVTDTGGSEANVGLATIVKQFTVGGNFLDPTAARTVQIWRAPFACTISGFHAIRSGGTTVTVNAQVNTTDVLASNLTVGETWTSGTVNSGSVSAGDTIKLELASVTGTPTEVAITLTIDK